MITARKRVGRWYWRCTFCFPAVAGSTSDFARLLVSFRRHFRVRGQHHAHVYRSGVRSRRVRRV